MDKYIYLGDAPLTSNFRNGPRHYKETYDQWKSLQAQSSGHIPDIVTHILYDDRNNPYINQYAEENNRTMFLSTWRVASGVPRGVNVGGDPLEESRIDYPGHWILGPGTELTRRVREEDNEIMVESTDGFVDKQGPGIIVPKDDENNNKIWEEAEYIFIRSIDRNENKLIIDRAFNGSPNGILRFPKRSYVAPIPWDARAKHEYTNWFFNIASSCPRDEKNMTALDILVDVMTTPLLKEKQGDGVGSLSNVAGLDLASGPLGPIPSNADYNNDGIVDGPEPYIRGCNDFYERVRSVMGEDRVIVTNLEFDFLGYVNGNNQEGLASPSDSWRLVSRTVNEIMAWKQLSPLPMISLAFVQHLTKEEESKVIQLHRLLNGYSTCLGMAADMEPGEDAVSRLSRLELFKGLENEAHWLGQPILNHGDGENGESIVRLASLEPNLLVRGYKTNDQTDWDSMLNMEEGQSSPAITARRALLIKEGNELILRPNKQGMTASLKLHFQLPQREDGEDGEDGLGDFTVFLNAKSDDGQLARVISLPRINVRVQTGPVRASLTNLDYLPVSYYIRGAPTGHDITMELRFMGGGDIRFRSIGVHAYPDAMACEFERGIVLVNPSLKPLTFRLKNWFGHRTGIQRLQAPTDIDRNELSEKLVDQYDQAMEQNDGSMVSSGGGRVVVVSDLNAHFLKADYMPSSKRQRRRNRDVFFNDMDITPIQPIQNQQQQQQQQQQDDEQSNVVVNMESILQQEYLSSSKTMIPRGMTMEQDKRDQEVMKSSSSSSSSKPWGIRRIMTTICMVSFVAFAIL